MADGLWFRFIYHHPVGEPSEWDDTCSYDSIEILRGW